MSIDSYLKQFRLSPLNLIEEKIAQQNVSVLSAGKFVKLNALYLMQLFITTVSGKMQLK